MPLFVHNPSKLWAICCWSLTRTIVTYGKHKRWRAEWIKWPTILSSYLWGCPDKGGLPADSSGPCLLGSGLLKVWASVPAPRDLASQVWAPFDSLVSRKSHGSLSFSLQPSVVSSIAILFWWRRGRLRVQGRLEAQGYFSLIINPSYTNMIPVCWNL